MTAPEPEVMAWNDDRLNELVSATEHLLWVADQESQSVDVPVIAEIRDMYKQITALAQQCAAAEEELNGASRLIHRQSQLLTGVVDAIRGKSPEVMWSHHDAPELVQQLIAERDAARAALAEIRDKFDCRCALVLNQACPKCIASDVLLTSTPSTEQIMDAAFALGAVEKALPTPTPQPEATKL